MPKYKMIELTWIIIWERTLRKNKDLRNIRKKENLIKSVDNVEIWA